MRRRRGSTLAEALAAAAILAVAGLSVTAAFFDVTEAGSRYVAGAQARRLLQQLLEQVRSGRGIPSQGTVGPFQVSVSTSPAPQPSIITPGSTPPCPGGAGGCSGALSTGGVASLQSVTVTITYSVTGSVVARGTAVTPP